MAKKSTNKRPAAGSKARGKSHSVAIVASGCAQQTLSELVRPASAVNILGSIVKQDGKSVLVIDSVQRQQSASVPIITNQNTINRLGTLLGSSDTVSISAQGHIVDTGAGSALVVENINQVTSLPILAASCAQSAIGKLATNGSGSINVTARIEGKGANRLLVLEAGK